MDKIKYIIGLSLLSIALFTGCSKDYIIGGDTAPTEVTESTIDYISKMEDMQLVVQLIKRANLENEVNNNTVFLPSDYAVRRYITRKLKRKADLGDDTGYTVDSIPVTDMGMYIIEGLVTRNDLKVGSYVEKVNLLGETIRVSLEEKNTDPTAAWDGAGQPGQGYQYSNFMEEIPTFIYATYKMGADWEETDAERISYGLDDPERDVKNRMSLSSLKTANGVLNIIYGPDYNYNDHNIWHTLYFFGTTQDDPK